MKTGTHLQKNKHWCHCEDASSYELNINAHETLLVTPLPYQPAAVLEVKQELDDVDLRNKGHDGVLVLNVCPGLNLVPYHGRGVDLLHDWVLSD